MKRSPMLAMVLMLLSIIAIGCTDSTSMRTTQQQVELPDNITEPLQVFPPDYSRAESIKITIYGGTATGQSFIVEREDERMMWNKDELPVSHDSTGTPYLPAINFRFNAPDEFLFDAIMDTVFSNREYMPADHRHSDDEGHYNIVVYDDEQAEIMAFDLFYMRCVLFNGSFYTISSEVDHSIAPKIDGYPFQVAYFINRDLYSAG